MLDVVSRIALKIAQDAGLGIARRLRGAVAGLIFRISLDTILSG